MTMSMAIADDVELVASSLTGDKKAFGRIVERYQNLVCGVTFTILGDRAASEDAAQETFVAAWQSLSALREPDRLRPWLAGIARNVARSATRKRRHDLVRHAEPIELAIPAHSESAPADEAARHEEESILWRVLEDMPESFRE